MVMLIERVYDVETTTLVQKNVGHTENIKTLQHIVERSQVGDVIWCLNLNIYSLKWLKSAPLKLRLFYSC